MKNCPDCEPEVMSEEARASLARLRAWQRLTVTGLERLCDFGDHHRWLRWLIGCGGLIRPAMISFRLWDRWDPRG